MSLEYCLSFPMLKKITLSFGSDIRLITPPHIRSLLFLASLFLAISGWSQQGTTSKWYFGRFAGLDFSPNPPTAITGSVNTREGSSSICDLWGSLLFYTNGDTVYTKQHQIMFNG